MDTEPTVFVVDGDEGARDGLGTCLRYAGLRTELYEGPDPLLDGYDASRPGCLLMEAQFGDLTCFDLRQLLAERGCHKPYIVITESGTVAGAVRAMRDGALDYMEKPFRRPLLLERVFRALDLDAAAHQRRQEQLLLRTELALLTFREHDVLRLVLAGKPTREIAALLSLSPKTVEVHRSNIVTKMKVDSISELVISLVRKQVDLPTPTLHRRRAV